MKTYILLGALVCSGAVLFAGGKKDGAAMQSEPPTGGYTVSGSEGYTRPYRLPKMTGGPVAFKESWGYVMQNRAAEFSPAFPLTDVALFAAEINSYGELTGVPKRSLLGAYAGRVHLTVICESRALTHLILDPQYRVRSRLLEEILVASKDFDGVQIDFELVPARNRGDFISFLRELKKLLPHKAVTVCVPARIKKLADDVYPYANIAAVTDRVVVMAYDEHWASSAPGAIASTDWCEKIAAYAKTTVPPEKLIMGVPFYGRTWQKQSFGKAWYHSGISRIMREQHITDVKRQKGVPYFNYEVTVEVEGWFDDVYSLVEKCRMYRKIGAQNIAFWRVGFEDPEFWQWLVIDPAD